MDPVLMAGAWAGALLAIAAFANLAYRIWVKAIRSILREELNRVWKDQDEIEQRLDALEASILYVREQLARLQQLMESVRDQK
jgi:F0F1-type ATP synthase membrane subunit b/b'